MLVQALVVLVTRAGVPRTANVVRLNFVSTSGKPKPVSPHAASTKPKPPAYLRALTCKT